MAFVVLLQAQPRLPSSGALTTVRVAGGGSRAYDQLGFTDWRAGIATRPRFTTAIDFDKGGPTGGAIPQTTGIRIAPSDKAYFSALSNVVWPGARVSIATGDDEGLAISYPLLLQGTVAASVTSGAAITLTIADLSADLNKLAVPNTFAGTGGLEGVDAATGRVKRRTFGVVFNVEGRVLDNANNVYEFGDPNFGVSSFDMLKDKGQAGPMTVLAWQGSALATLNALKAATVASGGGVVAPSISCAKWWTVPAGPLTADMTYNPGSGTQPAQLAATFAAQFSTDMTFANIAEAAGWINYASGVHIDDANETAASVLDRLLLPVFIVWVLRADGGLVFRRVSFDNPIATLRAETVNREVVFPALKTRKLGFQRNYRIHSESEISATLLAAKDIAYADGTPIETLKPAEAGANVTEARTAAAISGQGTFATISSAAYGSQYLTGFGALSPLSNLTFGSSFLLEQAGGVSATLAAFKTIQGIAASITGQGGFATINSAAYGSSFLTGFGQLSPLNNLFFGGAYLLEQSGGSPATLAAFKTIQGIAASITGQGAFATQNSAGYGSALLTGFGQLSPLNSLAFGSPYLLEQSGGASATLAQFKTSLGSAGGFLGQTDWATFTVPTARLTREDANLVYDGGLTLRAARWSLGSGWNWVLGAAGDGPYLQRGTGGQSISYSDFFAFAAGSGYLQSEMFASGMTAGTFAMDLEFYNGATLLTGGSTGATSAANGTGWSERGSTFTAPANTTRARVRVYTASDAQNTNAAIRRIKVSSASTRTKYSDEATVGAAYDDGTYMNMLKPEEAGGNRTEARIASAISGQTDWATYTGLTTTVVAGRTQRLQGDGYIESATIYKTGAGFLSAFYPAEGGANKTETRTAAAITGQSAFATYTGVPPGALIGGPTNLVPDGGFRFGGQGWSASAIGFGLNGTDSTGYAICNATGTNVSSSPQFPATAGAQYCLQAEMSYAAGGGNQCADVVFLNAQGQPLTDPGSRISLNTSGVATGTAIGGTSNYTMLYRVFTAPANTASATVRVYSEGKTSGTMVWRKIKLAFSAYPSPWDDTASMSARYGDDTLADALRPEEIGGNRTEARTASAIAGQGTFATLSNVSRGNYASYFNLNAFSLNYNITRSDGVSVVTESLVVTTLGIASAISGQGGLATRNAVDSSTMTPNSASDMVIMSNTNTYTGTGAPGTGSPVGGTGGTVSTGGSGGAGGGVGNTRQTYATP